MESDLAGTKDGISERFVPDQDRGRLIEVEHLCRYRWAAQIANGRNVLDAGCGTAYGSRMLAEGGAREVVGVDVAQAVLDAVAPAMPDRVSLRAGDLRKLEIDDDTFELIVCFEVIEHLEDPGPVLDELVRVLATGGLLLVSSPNRGVYPPGNPHHLNEFAPAELETELAARFGHVQLLRQNDYLVSALLSDASYELGDDAPIADLAVHKVVGDTSGHELYTIAMASDHPLPNPPELACMTGTLEIREWLSVFETQTGAITDKDNYIAELETRLDERARIVELLTNAEQRVAQMPELELRIADLELELANARRDAAASAQELNDLDQLRMYARRALRHVRPLVRLLRKARRKLRG